MADIIRTVSGNSTFGLLALLLDPLAAGGPLRCQSSNDADSMKRRFAASRGVIW